MDYSNEQREAEIQEKYGNQLSLKNRNNIVEYDFFRFKKGDETEQSFLQDCSVVQTKFNDYVSTNDVFAFALIQNEELGRDLEQIRKVFKLGGYTDEISAAKLKSWKLRTRSESKHYRKMPLDALAAFLTGLLKEAYE